MTKARDLANIISDGFTADDIPNLDTAKITTGTFVDARMPSTVLNSNVDLTNLSASNLTSGTLPDARFPATLPAVSGANLTNLPGGGKVLQVVSSTYSTQLSTTPSSFTDTGLSATITPSATSSKILILAHNSSFASGASYVFTGIERNISGGASTFLGDPTRGLTSSLDNQSAGGDVHSINYLDSPSTTSAITYDFQYKCGSVCEIQKLGSMAVMTLMEIGA